MSSNHTHIIFSIFLFFGVFLPTHALYAVSVTPRVIDLTALPRDIFEEKIVVTNTDQGPSTIFTVVNDVSLGTDGGLKEFVSPSMTDRTQTLASWIEIPRAGSEFKGGEVREIPLTIRVHPEAKPGEYHTMISFAPGTTIDDAGARVKQGLAPSVLINLTIAEKDNDFINLGGFSIKRFVTGFRDGDVQYRAHNTGDTELIPYGDIIIYNQRGEEMQSLPVNKNKQSVRPGDTITFSDGVPTDGLFGKYKAFLTLRYGENQAAVYDTVYFYVLPWKKLLIGFGVFAFLAVLGSLYMHRRYVAEDDDAHHLPLVVRETQSASHERDIVMKQ